MFIGLGVLTLLLFSLAAYLVVAMPRPLSAREKQLLGHWVNPQGETGDREFTFQIDRTVNVSDAATANDPSYVWKLDGEFLLVKEDRGSWERIGPITLEGGKFKMSPGGSMFIRVKE